MKKNSEQMLDKSDMLWYNNIYEFLCKLIWRSLKKSSGGNNGKNEIFDIGEVMLIVSKFAVSGDFTERIV